MRIVTDSTPVEDAKNPDKCNVFALLKLLACEDELKEWKEKYKSGGTGYGTVKKRLVELVIEFFKPYRNKRIELENNLDYVNQVLKEGAQKAKAQAGQTLTKAKGTTTSCGSGPTSRHCGDSAEPRSYWWSRQ